MIRVLTVLVKESDVFPIFTQYQCYKNNHNDRYTHTTMGYVCR